MDFIWRLLFNINHSNGVTLLIQNQRDKLAAHYATEAPASLFRYRPLENDIKRKQEIEALTNQKMWFSAKVALNDVFETHVKEPSASDLFGNQLKQCDNHHEQLDDMLKPCSDMLKQHPEHKKEIEQLIAEITLSKADAERAKADIEQRFQPYGEQNSIDAFWKSTAISCLSERNDNILMWSHYASSNRGMCIEYCTRELVQNTNFIIAPVNYSSEPPYRKDYSISELYLGLTETHISDDTSS